MLVCGIVLILCLFICNLLYANKQWNKLVDNNDETVLVKYEKLYLILNKDHRFLYNYAIKLNDHGKYLESISLLHELDDRMKNYDIQILFAENYKEMKMFDLEEFYLKQAYYMCPNRFLPLYKLVLLYDRLGRRSEAKELARYILKKKVKVSSLIVRRIKSEMYNYIDN